jgi:hypothetical protein
MKLIDFKYDEKNGWDYELVNFQRINLLVGDTGTGKTKFLNTIFNLGICVRSERFEFWGHWKIKFEINETKYYMELEIDEKKTIKKEYLAIINNEAKKQVLIDRTPGNFIFNEKELPALSIDSSSIWLLRDEELIKPLYRSFGLILRRNFSTESLIKENDYSILKPKTENDIKNEKSLEKLFYSEFAININLYLLKNYFPELFKGLVKDFKECFPFIEKCEVLDITEINENVNLPGRMPVFCIMEKEETRWIEFSQISSGMQKVLRILTDSYIMPNEVIYLVDEYENSLGINAIDFFPKFLTEKDTLNQIILTSHHPYIINQIPVKNWFIFHRKGHNVAIKFGDELIERFGKSKQQSFIQLINDPFYIEGIE